jgi:serine O-acetyltransferase
MENYLSSKELYSNIEDLYKSLIQLISFDIDNNQIVDSFINNFPIIDQSNSFKSIVEEIRDDREFIFNSDPAANSLEEVSITYPGYKAIATYRVAHHLHKIGKKLESKILSSFIHRDYLIDIHPAAEILSPTSIDHGTGVVIGETTSIGKRVRIYHGVTLGAISVDKHNTSKRHPTIEEDSTLYSNSTIIGGSTIIGKGSIIGANLLLTRSTPPNSKVYSQNNIVFSN